MRAREINDYYNQLGEGLGKIVPPQVTSVSRKPLSIALEEIEVGKIECERIAARRGRGGGRRRRRLRRHRPDDGLSPTGVRHGASLDGAARPAGRARRLRRDRRVQGGRGLPPPGRRRRARRARCSPRTRCASSARSPSRRSRRSRRARRCSTAPEPDPAHPPRPDRRPRSSSRPRPRSCSASTRPASPTTCSPRRCSRPGRRCSWRPAMHTEMWEHPAVQENLATLRRRGVHVVDPEAGRLAGGDVGAGRLADPGAHRRRRGRACSAAGRRPRRACGCSSPRAAPASRSTRCGSIGNRSSGKMGYAVAEVAARAGRGRHPRHHQSAGRCRPASTIVRGRDRRGDAATRSLARCRRRRRRRDGRRGRRLPAQGDRRPRS